MEVWKEVLCSIKEKIEESSFETWFKDTTVSLDNDFLRVHIDSEFKRHWLENKYHQLIFETVKEITGKSYEIQYKYISRNLDEDSIDDFHLHQDHSKYELVKRIESLESRVSRLEALK